jgi:translocator protein
VGLCLLVGVADGAVTATSVRGWYLSLTPPPGTPPNWVFGPVWGALYILMGVAAWLVWRQCGASRPIRLWGWQLLLNALWTPAFFGLHSPGLGLLVILALLVLLVLTTRAFVRISRPAAWMMLPYLAWAAYAAYLNAGFWWLNVA